MILNQAVTCNLPTTGSHQRRMSFREHAGLVNSSEISQLNLRNWTPAADQGFPDRQKATHFRVFPESTSAARPQPRKV